MYSAYYVRARHGKINNFRTTLAKHRNTALFTLYPRRLWVSTFPFFSPGIVEKYFYCYIIIWMNFNVFSAARVRGARELSGVSVWGWNSESLPLGVVLRLVRRV